MSDDAIHVKRFEEFQKFMKENSEERMLVRAHIIERFLVIENMLEQVIKQYFVADLKRQTDFGRMVMEGEFFTFEAKKRIFKKLCPLLISYGPIPEDIHKNLDFIQRIRNRLAHGVVAIGEKGFTIDYKDEKGNDQVLELKYTALTEFNIRVESIDKCLVDIWHKLVAINRGDEKDIQKDK